MRRCAFLYHPDRNPEDPAAHERFVSLLQGFDELRALVGEE
jgi:curved DNA-binding protein CbpA